MSDRLGDLAFADIPTLAGALRRGELSPSELVTGFVERLERLGPALNAVAATMAERGLAEARAAERALRRGRAASALTGIPYGAKDLLAARGAPTTWGVPTLRDRVIDHDAAVVERLRRAGAPLVAKLAMVELAGGGGYRYPDASLHGPGRTPWNLDRWSGGSSSGSGSAVAAGLVPFALGSETSGSIVTPAAYCGVTGLRPTYGLVSRRGAMPLAWSLDKVGPLARTAVDCGIVLGAIAGWDAGDPTSVRAPARCTTPARPRVAHAPVDLASADDAARSALADGYRHLATLGVDMVEAGLPSELPIRACVQLIIAGDAASTFHDLIDSPALDELRDERQRLGLRASLELPASAYLDAQRARGLVVEAFEALFERVDVVASVARPNGATGLDEPIGWPPTDDEPETPSFRNLTPAGNLAGLPALVLPCGFDAAGLPVALQIVGRPFSEAALIEIGRRFQADTDWHRRRPPFAA